MEVKRKNTAIVTVPIEMVLFGIAIFSGLREDWFVMIVALTSISILSHYGSYTHLSYRIDCLVARFAESTEKCSKSCEADAVILNRCDMGRKGILVFIVPMAVLSWFIAMVAALAEGWFYMGLFLLCWNIFTGCFFDLLLVGRIGRIGARRAQ